ncbi:MAG: hypothetical protein K6B75_02550 [Lachnospiraceae bacterium]|nr:hypothetical protein [Lachnospiraceae bacterium]
MAKEKNNKTMVYLVVSLMAVMVLLVVVSLLRPQGGKDSRGSSGKGGNQPTPTPTTAAAGYEDELNEDYVAGPTYGVILDINKEDFILSYYDVNKGKRVNVEYNGASYFENSYGSRTAVAGLERGDLCRIIMNDKTEVLKSAVSVRAYTTEGETFEYNGVTELDYDTETKQIKLDGKNFRYDDKLYVLSNTKKVDISSIIDTDRVIVRGIGERVVEIIVTKGHGSIALLNDDYFVGGLISVGNLYTGLIEKDMTYTVPEGTYFVSVKNGRYSGAATVKVLRDEKFSLDVEPFGPSTTLSDKEPNSETTENIKSEQEGVENLTKVDIGAVLSGLELDKDHLTYIYTPAGAKIFVNGENIGTAPVCFEKIIGNYLVSVVGTDGKGEQIISHYSCEGFDNGQDESFYFD